MKTKSITRYALIFAMAAAVPATVHAQETKAEEVAAAEAAVATGSLAAKLKDGVTFSILSKALNETGLDVALGGKDVFTVFAPTDEAFGKLPAGALDKLMLPENKEKLRSLLLYHVVAGQMNASTLQDGDLKTMNGEKVEIDLESDGKIEVEDSNVVNADQSASNGVYHVIDKVLIPESLDGFAGLDAD